MMALSTIASRRFEGALAIDMLVVPISPIRPRCSRRGPLASPSCVPWLLLGTRTRLGRICACFHRRLTLPSLVPSHLRGIRHRKGSSLVDVGSQRTDGRRTRVPSILDGPPSCRPSQQFGAFFHGSGRRGIPPWPWTGRNLHLSSCTRSSMDGFLDPFSPLSFLSHLATAFRRRPSRAFVSHPSMEARRRTPSWPSPVHVVGEEEARRRSPFLHSFG